MAKKLVIQARDKSTAIEKAKKELIRKLNISDDDFIMKV